MVYRLTWIGIAAGIWFSLERMENLLRPASQGPTWQLVLVAALLLGCVITWVARSYRVSALGVIAANLVGLALATIRIGAPDTAFLGFLPTWSTFSEVGRELEFALDLIRFGTAPLLPVASLILILTWVFWIIGILIVWGLHAGRPAVAVIPGVVLYLQLATMDRSPTSFWATVAYLGLVVATLAAIAHDERTVGTGRVRRGDRRFIRGGTAVVPITVAVFILFLGVGSTMWVTSRTPNAGALEWRTTGFGNGLFGGVSFNYFVGIQQQLVNLSDRPVFTAQVQGAIDESELYWKLIALEEFDGVNWFPRTSISSRPELTGVWETQDQVFFGPTEEIVSTITIDALAETYLPAPYTPTDLASSYPFVEESFRVRQDGAVKIDARSFEGLEYSVASDVPQPNLAVLASDRDSLSPMFAQAARDGLFSIRSEPGPPARTFEAWEDLLDTSALEDDDEAILTEMARGLTAAASTNFERAILLEDFFRDPDLFTYNTQAAAGSSAESLVEWLLVPGSTNYREGYCEQFAASMAILARTLGMPSRVILGFAPGDVAADGTVTVRENDAHAWVEVWFQSQGWVRFDPTPRSANDTVTLSAALGFDPSSIVVRETAIEAAEEEVAGTGPFSAEETTRADLEAMIAAGENQAEAAPRVEPDFEAAEAGPPWLLIGFVLILLVIGTSPALRAYRRKRRIEQMRTGDITAAWAEIVDELSDLGRPVSASATPTEAAADVDDVMLPLAQAYERQIYGPTGELSEGAVREARASFGLTHRHLQDNAAPQHRVMRWLRFGSLRRKRR